MGAAARRPFLRVVDNGRGVAMEDYETIFEPYVSTNGESVGLGLSVSRHLARLMGGDLNYGYYAGERLRADVDSG